MFALVASKQKALFLIFKVIIISTLKKMLAQRETKDALIADIFV